VVDFGGFHPAHPASNPSRNGPWCHTKKIPSPVPYQSTDLRPVQVALSQVMVPLCKGRAGVQRFSRSVREDLLS
jgi:hypothetical protein